MSTTIAGVGPQLDRAAAGDDPRGWLVFEYLPDDLQRAEDSTAVNDRDRARLFKPRGTPGRPQRPRSNCWVISGMTVPDPTSKRSSRGQAGHAVGADGQHSKQQEVTP